MFTSNTKDGTIISVQSTQVTFVTTLNNATEKYIVSFSKKKKKRKSFWNLKYKTRDKISKQSKFRSKNIFLQRVVIAREIWNEISLEKN